MSDANSSRARLAILGTGLMGGSLGMAMLQADAVDEVVGYDADPATARLALERGALTEIAQTPQDAVATASYVVIAAPVGVIPSVLESIAPAISPGTVLTDVGSTKRRVVEVASRVVPSGSHFIGGHPLAGSEKEGIEAADPEIYRDCIWFLTPTESTDAAAYRTLVRLLSKVGARILSLDSARHDELVALTSHLPQILASTLMGFAAQMSEVEGGTPLIAAGGFRDMTRIAASSPDLWVDIIKENRDALGTMLTRFERELMRVGKLLDEEDWDALGRFFDVARSARRDLPGKPGLEPADLVEILIPVPDRPGVLANVTTTLGEASVNIEDIDIVHSPEGGRGTIHLWVNGADAMTQAIDALIGAGYAAERA